MDSRLALWRLAPEGWRKCVFRAADGRNGQILAH